MFIKEDMDVIAHNKNSRRLKSAIYWKSTITDIICTINSCQPQWTNMPILLLIKKMVTITHRN